MLRNREIQRLCICAAAITAVFAGVGLLLGPDVGLLVLAEAAVLGAVFFHFTRARYRRLARLAEEIDQMLHNAGRLWIGESEEGELSILESEISKMTLRIREQNHTLKQEKQHLADSLANVAHQLRTPLTSIGIILTLLTDASDEREQKRLLREAEALLAQTDWLLEMLLKLSRLDAGIVEFQREPVEVKAVVGAALRPLLISMELHEIVPQVNVPAGIAVMGDEHWLAEAIKNILKNCADSVGRNGTITISGMDNPLFTEITIRDSGAGFREEDLPHVFERFYRGRQSAVTGYGIGLALSKTVIVRQGGTVIAENHPQGGAVFTICFPK